MSDEKPADRDTRPYDAIEEEEVIDEEADRAQSDLPGDLEGSAAPGAELEPRLQDSLADQRRRRAAAQDRRSRRHGPPTR